MPLPLVPVVVGVILSGALATVIPKLAGKRGVPKPARKRDGKRVAILGRQQVGKSTLLHLLREGSVPETISSTGSPVVGGEFSMEIGGKVVNFNVAKDLPGNDGLGFGDWKEALSGADYLWYLFRSDLIAQGDPDEIRLVESHLDMFKVWIDDGNTKVPKTILIGTCADWHPSYERHPTQFANAVGAARPIKFGRVKLENAGVVVGSLVTHTEADRLVESLRSRLA
ncbi:GTPase domain-containing protein [Diaminobutyricimonas sp. LJ205]|uniref:GTPase domain-containing protein n=1 Tax=Diaminobutyricimonas sp. LJ205 TaxID=2683590 RepID=UPI0012F482F0|nr:hypothetical protein [Diaminobutyricimonas sp. LJ205]